MVSMGSEMVPEVADGEEDKFELQLDDVVIMTPRKGNDGASSAASSQGGEMCSHCTREGCVAGMVNFGCKAYPKYRCRPCHAAVRFLERAAKSKGDKHYEAFCDHRRRQPIKFSQSVLLCRMAPPGETPLPGGDDVPDGGKCRSAEDRHDRAAAVVSSVYSLRATEEFEEVLYLTERQFRAHMRWFEEMTREEAQQAWDSAMLDKEQEKRNCKGVVQLAVLTKVGKRHIKQRGSKREMQKHASLSDSDLDNAENVGKRLRSHVESDPSHLHKDLATFSNAFVAPESRSSSAGAQSTAQILTNLSGMQSDASAHVDAESFAAKCGVVRPDEDGLKKMGLTKDVAESKSKYRPHFRIEGSKLEKCPKQSSKVSRLLRSVLCESMLSGKARQVFNGHCRSLLSRKWEQKGAPCKALESVIEKIGDQNVEVLSTGATDTLNEFKDAALRLSTARNA
eukprot:5316593-Amphidinium_carterae.1